MRPDTWPVNFTLRAPESVPATALQPEQQRDMPGVQQTDLGAETMSGFVLHCIRKEHTIPSSMSGTGRPVVIADEYWYSEVLSIYMILRHHDPRTGEQIVAVRHVERTEPPAEQFSIPADYKVVDETTPSSPGVAQ